MQFGLNHKATILKTEVMKHSLFILPVALALLSSCERRPEASFIVSSNPAEVYEAIHFTNTSSPDADYFEWDFGDDTYSNAINPQHFYERAGIYQVELTAFKRGGGSDRAYLNLDVLTTALNVIVEEFYDHYRVPEASIILYPTQADWDHETNPIVEGFTDANGFVRFENLNPVIYYLDVWHPSHNNYQLASEDVNWIRTQPLVRNAENDFVAYVDYVGTVNRKDGRQSAQYKILKIEPRVKSDNQIMKK